MAPSTPPVGTGTTTAAAGPAGAGGISDRDLASVLYGNRQVRHGSNALDRSCLTDQSCPVILSASPVILSASPVILSASEGSRCPSQQSCHPERQRRISLPITTDPSRSLPLSEAKGSG